MATIQGLLQNQKKPISAPSANTGYQPGNGITSSQIARGVGGLLTGNNDQAMRAGGQMLAKEAVNYGIDQAGLTNTYGGSMAGAGASRAAGALLGGADAGQAAEEAAWGAGRAALQRGIVQGVGTAATPYVGAALGLGEKLAREGKLEKKDAADAVWNGVSAAMGPYGILMQGVKMAVDYKGAKDKKHQMEYGYRDQGAGAGIYQNGKFSVNPVTTVNGKPGGKLAAYQNMYSQEVTRRMNDRLARDPEYKRRMDFLASKGVYDADVPLVAYTTDELDDLMSAGTIDELRSKAVANVDRFYGDGAKNMTGEEYTAKMDKKYHPRENKEGVARSAAYLPHPGDEYMDEYYGYDKTVKPDQRGMSAEDRTLLASYNENMKKAGKESLGGRGPSYEERQAYQQYREQNRTESEKNRGLGDSK